MKKTTDPRAASVLITLVLIIVTLVAYRALAHNGFVRFDDHYYLTDNPIMGKGFTWETVAWAFSLNHTISYWHPLTWLSLMLDHQLFGMSPVGYHLVNLLIHAANAVLIFHVLKKMTGQLWTSALVAFLFALHPLNVESVAWAVERKTVLSSFLLLLTVAAYVRYVRQPAVGKYLVVIGLFSLGLMAKPMVVTLPFLLLLLDFWPLRRLPGRCALDGGREDVTSCPTPRLSKVLLEKAPLLILSLVSVAISLFSLKDVTTAATAESLAGRFAHAAISYVHYIFKMFRPADLAVFYPQQGAPSLWLGFAAAVLLAIVTACAVFWRKNRPWFAAGWFWYLGMFTPVIGLVRAGTWPSMADRFAYLPFIGLYIMIAWSLAEISGKKAMQRVSAIAAGISLVLLTCGTTIQAGYWKDSITLFERALQVTPDNLLIYANLGESYLIAGQYEKAFSLFRKMPGSLGTEIYAGYERNKRHFPEILNAISQKIVDPAALSCLHYLTGKVYEDLDGHVEAVESFNKALRLNGSGSTLPFQEEARRDAQKLLLGLSSGLDRAREYVKSHPADADSRWNLALKLERLGLDDEALQHYRELERAGLSNGVLYYHLGNISTRAGDTRGAIEYLERSLRFNPSHPEVLNSLGLLYKERKEFSKAIAAFKTATDGNPGYPTAPYNLAVTYFELNDKEQALRIFRKMQTIFPHYNARIREYLR